MTLSRRTFMGTLAAAGATALVPLPAAALTDAEARRLVDRLVGDINRIIASGRSEAAMISEFQRIFTTYADVPTIARSALGPAARTASSAQLNAYTNAFAGYIARRYGKRFREFQGGRIDVQNTRKIRNRQFEVQSVARLPGQAPFALSFLVSDQSGSLKFFNMIIEGVNLLTAEATEVRALLDRNGGDIGRLTQALNRAG
ncbi:MAG: MlaC/ttg2D family ABC transporter substrate-binding protein [Shimia sp.]